MKIVHISISGPFIDGWGYQENLLPQYLQKVGVQNYIVASSNDFPNYLKSEVAEEIKAKGNKYTLDGIVVCRIPTKKISTSFIYPRGLKEVLKEIQPDVIFHHNLNCTSMPIAARYAKKHGIPMVVDNHADTINMTKNKLWIWFYYKFLIGVSCKLYQKQIYKAYGVTHARCDFIHDYYGLTRKKIDFLPIGADIDVADTISPKAELREKYGFNDTDFVVVTGGKMGKGKGTDLLINAAEALHKLYPRLKLVLFGLFENNNVKKQAEQSTVTTVHGWCDRIKTLELLKMADVACWPIHHTTLIEDAVSVCTPIINRKTDTTEHLVDGNGVWLEKSSEEEIKDAILHLMDLNEQQKEELRLACEKKRENISYNTLAKKLLIDISKFSEFNGS